MGFFQNKIQIMAASNSGTTVPSEEERFRQNISDFTMLIRELLEDCSRRGKTNIDPNIITVASAFIESYDPKTLLTNFVHYSYPYWDKISKHEEAFFRENCADVFKDIPMDHINAFKELFSEDEQVISDDDKDAMWDYFDSFVKICIKYIHRQRGPKIRDIGKGPQRVYSKNEFPDVHLQKYAQLWDVKLEW